MKTAKKDLSKSQLEIEFELTAEEFNEYVDRALDHLKSHTKIDGFRQGQVPRDLVEKKVGQENLLMEAGDLAVKKSYAGYINENALEPIGRPEVQIKKIAKGNPFLFTVKISILPEVILPNYKEIASQVKAESISVDEKEIEDALSYLQKSRAKFSQIDRGAEVKDFVEIEYSSKDISDGKKIKDRFILGQSRFMRDFEDNILGMKAEDQKEFKVKFPPASNAERSSAGWDNAPNNPGEKESTFKVKMVSVQKIELPEINDEFAKSLGVFDSLVALKSNLKEGITMEKQETEKQKKQGEVLSNIAEKIKFDLPEKMVELEKDRLLHDLKHQVTEQFKMPFGEYLKSVKKTEEEIKNNYKLDAEKRIKNYLVLRQIGKAENVEVSKEEIEEEMNKFIKNYTKEEADKIDIDQLKEYTKDAIMNEKVFQILETLSQNFLSR
ncbi:MAG: trigger factor [Patescibacteria group bacterium]